jgi:hypothetical protein
MPNDASNIQDRASRFKNLIQMTKLSPKQFAQLMGKTPRLIYMWQAGTASIPSKSVPFIVAALEKIGICCSVEWLLYGEGNAPGKTLSNLYNAGQDNIFEQFNLDFSISSLLNMYKKIYPDFRFLLIEDHRFSPRIEPKCLLIAVPVPSEKLRSNWPWGYLHSLEDFQIIPIDIKKVENKLLASPFEQKTYVAKKFTIDDPDKIYPIVNIRPIY